MQSSIASSRKALIFFGLGEILGAFTLGFIVDKYGSKFGSLVICFLIILSTSFVLYFLIF
jgi:predicted MFS family arabinose efflux permease